MLNILVVDDNPINLAFFSAALGQLGHHCTVVDNGSTAVEHGDRTAYELILIDARMPGLDGIATLARIRDHAGPSQHATALATTADGQRQSHAKLLEAGFVAVLVKPISVAELADALREHDPNASCIDDARALAAVAGDREVVNALRQLLLAELERLPGELKTAEDHPQPLAALAERMHRLQASAGFCGITVLELAARELEHRARSETNWPQPQVDALLHRCLIVASELRKRSDA